MYTLYYSPGTASMAVHLALIEIGAAYRLELVDLERKEQRSETYLRLNPLGRVPTLVIDGQAYFESSALLMMLADRHPEARLSPPIGTPERNAWYQWLAFLSNALGATFRSWFYPGDLGADEHAADVRTALKARIEGVWARLDHHLAAHGPYLMGEQISAADLQLIMYMRWSRNMPRTALDWPALKRFASLVRGRDSWQHLCDAEGLDEWRGPD
ncbi:MAG: glutathione S-transferase family protein [Xanthomonadales bacterium]|nr:glutathione S-transferase family protein [Xanthomonadales bacterium]